MKLSNKIEALLFYTTEPLAYKKMSKILDVAIGEIEPAVAELEQVLAGRGVQLIKNGEEVALVTHPEAHAMIEALRKEELGSSLSRAALETLTIITYQNGITKSEIDYIRGVNSNFILRNLLMRGLVEKVPNEQDKRSPLYRPTFDTLAHLGIAQVEELPEYDILQQQLEQLSQEHFNEQSEQSEQGSGDDETMSQETSPVDA